MGPPPTSVWFVATTETGAASRVNQGSSSGEVACRQSHATRYHNGGLIWKQHEQLVTRKIASDTFKKHFGTQWVGMSMLILLIVVTLDRNITTSICTRNRKRSTACDICPSDKGSDWRSIRRSRKLRHRSNPMFDKAGGSTPKSQADPTELGFRSKLVRVGMVSDPTHSDALKK